MNFAKQLGAVCLVLSIIACSFCPAVNAQDGGASKVLNEAQEAYSKVWRLVNDSYLDRTFGGQDWSGWEHKFDGQLKTSDDEFNAVKTMLDSLHDPYTRGLHLLQQQQSSVAVSTTFEGESSSISSKFLSENLGYIKIQNFLSSNCARDFKTCLKQMKSADAIVLDLRGNQGGLVSSALQIADMLCPGAETLVSTESRDGRQEFTSSGNQLSNQSLVVLVDEHTASASEILTAALQDNHRAVIIGSKTFGKGVVQEETFLSGMAVRITVSKYLTPSGSDINKVGIVPDLVVNPQDAAAEAVQYFADKFPAHVCVERSSRRAASHAHHS